MSEIEKFKRRKPFEQLPRDLLQNKNLSFGAIGLLAHLESHSEGYELRKVTLYKRTGSDERRKVSSYWKELENEGYMLSFKKMVGGKGPVYKYIFSIEPFSPEEIHDIVEKWKHQGFKLLTELPEERLLYKTYNSRNVDKSTSRLLYIYDSRICTANKDLNNNKDLNISNKESIIESKQENPPVEKSKEVFCPPVEKPAELILDTDLWQQTLQHTYKNILPSKVLDCIVEYSTNLTEAQLLIKNLLSSKAYVTKLPDRESSFSFEELLPDQVKLMKDKVLFVLARLHKEEFIKQYGKVHKPDKFMFTVFRKYFYDVIPRLQSTEEMNVSQDISDVLLKGW